MIKPSGGNLEMKNEEFEKSEKQADPNGEAFKEIEEDDERKEMWGHNPMSTLVFD